MNIEEPKKRPWWKKVLIVVVILIVLVVFFFLVTAKFRNKSQTGDNFNQAKKSDCQKNPNPLFTAEFTDFSNLKQTAPIGSVMAGSPGRAYVMVKSDDQPNGGELKNRVKTPLYAPADATIISLVYARRDPSNPSAPGEYRLEFQISCEVTFNFDHIDDVVDKIRTVAPATPSDKSNDLKSVSIPVKAGELVGYSDGTPMAGSFDLFLLNSTKTVPHLNPERWKWDQVTTADCPYDYYTSDLKEKYYSIMRSMDGQPLIEQSCGSPSHDIAGTASGGWFLGKDATDQTGPWLEIANANGKTELIIRESGANQSFSIRDYQNKKLPDAVKIGDSTCYSDSGKWAYIKVDSAEQISFAKGEGSCPSSMPASAEIWER